MKYFYPIPDSCKFLYNLKLEFVLALSFSFLLFCALLFLSLASCLKLFGFAVWETRPSAVETERN